MAVRQDRPAASKPAIQRSAAGAATVMICFKTAAAEQEFKEWCDRNPEGIVE